MWQPEAALERALREANERLNRQVEERTAELTELSQHLIRVSEEEKARIARELHDTLGSNLTAINMDLNWIKKRLPPRSRTCASDCSARCRCSQTPWN